LRGLLRNLDWIIGNFKVNWFIKRWTSNPMIVVILRWLCHVLA